MTWFPKAIKTRLAPSSGGTFFDVPPKACWHTTQTSVLPSYETGFFPHFTIFGNLIYQHLTTLVAARALKNRPGGVQTNRMNVIQIEVVGFANTIKYRPVMRELAEWLERVCGIPRITTVQWVAFTPDRQGPTVRLSDRQWEAYAGHLGHMHVPENDHGDPGWPFPITEILAQPFPAEKIKERFAMLEKEDKEWIKDLLNDRLDELYRRLARGEFDGKKSDAHYGDSIRGVGEMIDSTLRAE